MKQSRLTPDSTLSIESKQDGVKGRYIFDQYLLECKSFKITKRLNASPDSKDDNKYGRFDFLEMLEAVGISIQFLASFKFIPEGNMGVCLLNWGMGKGKTTQIKQVIDDAYSQLNYKTYAIAHRRKLLTELAQKLNLDDYQEIKRANMSFQQVIDKNPRGIACCINSISMLNQSVEILFIDEIEGVLATLASDALFERQGAMVENVFLLLIRLVQRCRFVFLADANMDSTTLIFLKMAEIPQHNIVLSECARIEREYTFVGTHHTHLKFIAAQLNEGKNIVIGCMARSTADKAKMYLQETTGVDDILCFTGHSDDVEEFLSNPDQDKFKSRILIFTPVFDAGISIDIKDWFHSMHVFVSNTVGDATTFIQMSGRLRNPSDSTIFFSGRRTARPRFNRVQKALVNLRHDRNIEVINEILSDFVPEYKYPKARDYRYQAFLDEYLYCTIRRGKGMVTEFVLQKLNALDRSDEFKNKFQTQRLGPTQAALNEAESVIYATNVSKAYFTIKEITTLQQAYTGLNPDDLFKLEKHRLTEFYGDAIDFEDPDVLGFIVRDRYQLLTEQCQLFARILLVQSDSSLDDIFIAERDEFWTRGSFDFSPLASKAFVLGRIFKEGNVYLSSNLVTECTWNKFSILEAVCWANNNKEILTAVKLPIVPDLSDHYVRWFNKLIGKLGLNTEPFQQSRKNKRIRCYRIDESSLKEMYKLSLSEQIRLQEGGLK